MIKSHHFSAILTASPAIFDWTEADFLVLLNNTAKSAELTPVSQASFAFQPQGISAVILLEESHVALHFWPEKGKVLIDIHVCDYQQDNEAKARNIANLLAFEISENTDMENWNYLVITG